MSEILASIGGMISEISASLTTSMISSDTSEELVSLSSFYQAYRQCRSHHEISVLVANHAKYLKWQLSSSQLTDQLTSTVLERCMICKAIGQDVSFAGIHAIQLAQSAQRWDHKLTAYVACCELLDEHSDMAILMVSTLQHDLRSKHVSTICLALSTAAIIVSAELIPSVDAIVCDRLKHSSPIVRKKAVACLGAFLKKNDELIESRLSNLRAALSDKDPSTMAVALQVMESLPSKFIHSSDDLHKPLLFILNQFLHGNAPKKFTKSGVCGPHVIATVIKLLAKLNHSKAEWKERTQLSLLAVMDKYALLMSTPGVMVMSECCQALLKLSVDTKHITRITDYASHLLKSDLTNFKFMGLTIFSELINRDRKQISAYQNPIVSSLNSTDWTIAEKAMLLIIQLTNASNVQSVYELYSKTSCFKSSTHFSAKYAIVILTSCQLSKISVEWFAEKLADLLQLGGMQRHTSSSGKVSSDSPLNCILTYLSRESIQETAVKLYSCLNDRVLQNEVPNLNIFSVMLWLRMAHKTVFSECDDTCVSLLRSSIQQGSGCDSNISILLTAVRGLLVDRKLSLQKADVAALKDLTVLRAEEAIFYHYYFEDISDVVSNPAKYDDVKDNQNPSIWSELEQYKNEKISSKECRHDDVSAVSTSAISFQFTGPESTSLTTSQQREVQLKHGKTVWTAKGRVEPIECHAPQSAETGEEAAPVEFDIEESETPEEKLTKNIFSQCEES